MRLVAGVVLVARGLGGLVGALAPGPAAAPIARVALGLLLIAGLWTPVAGVLVAFVEIAWFVSRSDDLSIHLLLSTLGISLALLGPGRWSVDSRLFGWRRIDLDTGPRQ